jgi:type II secretory pathway component GspD/PulD (secretin)
LRVLFDLRYIIANPAAGTIVIRAPQQTMDVITEFLDGFDDVHPQVVLQVKVFAVSAAFARDIGASIPTQFTIFNVPTEINKVLTGSSFQQIIAALQAAGEPVNASTILAALLATGSSSPLTQPFAVFGGGITLTGVTIPNTVLNFLKTESIARTVDDVVLRAGYGSPATLKVGERYPVVSTLFSATSPTLSTLAGLGVNTSALTSGVSVPSPQFYYEDLGLVLKATPRIGGGLVNLEYEMTVRSLGPTQPNGLPLIINRETKGTISAEDGTSVVIAGLMDKSEMAAINGIPLLSMVPGLGRAFSVESKMHTWDELLIVMTPHIALERSHPGSYLRIPTNVPK